jgi:hypothetical protein
MCSHTTIYVSRLWYIRVLILLNVSSYCLSICRYISSAAASAAYPPLASNAAGRASAGGGRGEGESERREGKMGEGREGEG